LHVHYCVLTVPRRYRNSAIAYKPRDAFVQYAVAWPSKNTNLPACFTTPNLVILCQRVWT